MSHRSRRKRDLFRQLHVEGLEERRVLAGDVSATFLNHLLFIQGTSGVDHIQIVEQGNLLTVKSNSTPISILNGVNPVASLSADQVWGIDIDSKGNNDLIDLAASGSNPKQLPMLVHHTSSGAIISVDYSGDGFSVKGDSGDVVVVPQGSIVGSVTSTLASINNLLATGASTTLRLGEYFKATVTERVSGGATTLEFKNVQLNVGRFAADFLGNVSLNLKSVTGSLNELADALDKPLINKPWASGMTGAGLLKLLGYNKEADTAKALATAIHTINSISSSFTSRDAWVNLGGFTAKVNASGAPLTTLSTSINGAAAGGINSALGSLSDTVKNLQGLSGVTLKLNDPATLLKLITGESATLFSYNFNFNIAVSNIRQRLATLPVSPVTATSVDIDLVAGVNLNIGAVFGFDTAGFQAGNLAQGLFIQNAHVTASLTVGVSGTVNEAGLLGYRLTGQVTGSISASAVGANSSGKITADQLSHGSAHITIGGQQLHNAITTQALGPKEMLTETFKQVSAIAKNVADALASKLHTSSADVKNAIKASWPDSTQFASALKAAGVNTTVISRSLKEAFNKTNQEVADILKSLNVGAAEIAGILKNAFGVGSQEAAKILQNAGAALNDVAGALKSQYAASLSTVATTIGTLTHDVNAVARALKANFSATTGDVAKALYGVSWIFSSDVANALKTTYGSSINTVATALGGIVKSTDLIAGALKNNFSSASLNDVAKALYSVPWIYSADVAKALKGTYGASINNVAKALGEISSSVNTIAKALKGAFSTASTLDAANAIYSIWWTNYSNVADALKNTYGVSMGNVAKTLSKMTHDINTIAGALKTAFSASYATVADKLWNYISWTTFGDVADALKNTYHASIENVTNAISTVSHNIHEISQALKSNFSVSTTTIARVLWNEIDWTTYGDVANALKKDFNVGAESAAKLLKGVGAAAGTVNSILRNTFNVSRSTAESFLRSAGYTASQVNSALGNVSNVVTHGVDVLSKLFG